MAKKQKQNLPPRRKRMKRPQRLESAKSWLETYEGNKVVRDYRKRYGVDFETAFTELALLGVPIDPDYRERVLQSAAAQAVAKRRKKAERKAEQERQPGIESDDHFAFIVGYTSGGAPYGLTWAEWEALEEEE
jgi:hypothetical protein